MGFRVSTVLRSRSQPARLRVKVILGLVLQASKIVSYYGCVKSHSARPSSHTLSPKPIPFPVTVEPLSSVCNQLWHFYNRFMYITLPAYVPSGFVSQFEGSDNRSGQTGYSSSVPCSLSRPFPPCIPPSQHQCTLNQGRHRLMHDRM